MPDLTRMTTPNLIKRMERAGDFNYDDETVELNRRLEGTGFAWKWSEDFFHPHVIVYRAHPVFGPGRQAAAKAADDELKAAKAALTGFADYDTPAMRKRYQQAVADRAHYPDYHFTD